jgi:hypothetical protein
MPYLRYSTSYLKYGPKVHFSVPAVQVKKLYLRYRFTTKKSPKKDSPDGIRKKTFAHFFFTKKYSRDAIQPLFRHTRNVRKRFLADA